MATTITPCLFYDRTAEEAAAFYCAVLPRSEIRSVTRVTVDTPFQKAGDVMSVEFTLLGQPFVAINGGAQFPFTEAVSFQLHCDDQAEVDRVWDALLADGGEESQCGWLKDRYGLSWQVIPTEMTRYVGGPDPDGAGRAVQAMLGMRKLDLAALKAAYLGE